MQQGLTCSLFFPLCLEQGLAQDIGKSHVPESGVTQILPGVAFPS